jgi:hypothetical protein
MYSTQSTQAAAAQAGGQTGRQAGSCSSLFFENHGNCPKVFAYPLEINRSLHVVSRKERNKYNCDGRFATPVHAGWMAGWLRSDDQQLIRQLKLLQGTKVHNRVGGERETIYLGINLDNGGVNSITYCLG